MIPTVTVLVIIGFLSGIMVNTGEDKQAESILILFGGFVLSLGSAIALCFHMPLGAQHNQTGAYLFCGIVYGIVFALIGFFKII